MVLAFGHALGAYEALGRPYALPGFLEVLHSLFEDGVFVSHDESIRTATSSDPPIASPSLASTPAGPAQEAKADEGTVSVPRGATASRFPAHDQRRSEKHQSSYSQIGRSTRRRHPPDAGAGNDALGTVDGAWWRLRFILSPNGHLAITLLADQLFTGYPVVVGIQVVGLRAVLRIFPLCGSLGGEVSTIQVSATIRTAAGAIRLALAGHPVSIRV
jgi:hypothetical protein